MGKVVQIEELPHGELLRLAESLRTADWHERTATAMLRLWLAGGELASVLGVPRIAAARFEFSVPGGRIDLLLFHSDRSVTIVETKPEGNASDIVGGIGQLAMYAVQLPRVLSGQWRRDGIRKILCAATEPARAADLLLACRAAGVRFVPLPQAAAVREIVQRLAVKAA